MVFIGDHVLCQSNLSETDRPQLPSVARCSRFFTTAYCTTNTSSSRARPRCGCSCETLWMAQKTWRLAQISVAHKLRLDLSQSTRSKAGTERGVCNVGRGVLPWLDHGFPGGFVNAGQRLCRTERSTVVRSTHARSFLQCK